MIIVEGCDGCGKTVLIGQITKKFPQLRVSNHGARDDLWKKAVRERVYDALGTDVKGFPDIWVHDRLYFSELVYGPILRGSSIFSQRETAFVARTMEFLDPLIIFCTPPLEQVRINITEKKQLEGVPENLEEIYNDYRRIMTDYSFAPGLNIVDYDYTKQGPNRILRKITDHLKSREYRVCHPRRGSVVV